MMQRGSDKRGRPGKGATSGAGEVREPGVPYADPPPDVVAELISRLEADPVLRTRVAALLGIPAGLPDVLNRLLDELRELRIETVTRFEAMQVEMDRRFDAMQAELDRRFEAMERRFEAMERRFEAMDKRFDATQAEMDKRFDATQAEMDKRFDAVQADLERRFEAIDRRFEELRTTTHEGLGEIKAVLHTTLLQVGRFTDRLGHRLEDVVAAALRFGVDRPDIRADQVRVRQEFVDRDGKLGRKGRRVELDVVAATEGRTYLMEVRTTVKINDVDSLVERAAFVAALTGLQPGAYEPVLATFYKADDIVKACRAAGVTLI